MKRLTNLLFVLLIILCASCSNDDNTNDDNDSESLVPSLTGAITKDAVNFDSPNLKCTDCIIEILPSTKMDGEQYATMTLKFNDNVELIFKGIYNSLDKTEAEKVYRLLKNCITITVNLKDGTKIISSEVFDNPDKGNGGWWEMASDDSYFTIDLNLKGKQYTYKGLFKYTFPEEPIITTGAITDKGVDFNNKNLKCISCSFNALSSSEANMTLLFNDNVEVIFKGLTDAFDKTEADKVYRLLKNCETITVNLKDGTKIISSEVFDTPNKGSGGWWNMANNNSYFTVDLDLKGKKYEYKGQIKYIF